ncbi:MAG: DUF4190 domain-containing protein [Micrococcales bacterium]|nr:DUF4190 domain-containing protein [Micrococcales bacterium]
MSYPPYQNPYDAPQYGSPPPAYPAPGYGPPGMYAVERKTNGLAIASLICSLLGMSLLGIIFGHIAVRQIRQTGDGGEGMAKAGLIIGYIVLVLVIIAIIINIVFAVWLVSTDPEILNTYDYNY